jgi:hypothetical protein
MQYTEEDLLTKDNVNLKSYIILQTDPEQAKKSPTILYFHVSFSLSFVSDNLLSIFFCFV